MKVLAINGSARKNGNTSQMIQWVFTGLNQYGIETESIELSNQWIHPCKACFACGGKGNCIHSDDPFQFIFDKIKSCDGLIMASPVYSANVSANLQALIERCAVVCDMNPGLLKHKVGVALAVARRAGTLHALDAIDHFYLNHEMIVVGSTYWNMGYGQLQGDIEKDTEAHQTMMDLSDNMAFVLNGLHHGQTK